MMLLPLALALALFPARAPTVSSADGPACALARQILEDVTPPEGGRALVVSDKGAGIKFSPLSLSQFLTGWTHTAPSPEHARLYLARADRAAVEACATLRRQLTERGIGVGPEAIRKATAPGDAKERYTANFLALSLPVLSQDGRAALVDSDWMCGGLCGIGQTTLYRRDRKGVWREVGSRVMWLR